MRWTDRAGERQRTQGFRSFVLVLLVALTATGGARAATFTVDSTGDGGDSDTADGVCDDGSGSCTLRAAIEQANSSGGADSIHFSIAGAGVPTIAPLSQLPVISDDVDLDGTTQPAGMVSLDGSSTSSSSGLGLSGSGSTVRGFVINNFLHGVFVGNAATGNTIAGNFLGVDTTGTSAIGNSQHGIELRGGSNNHIGGPNESDRNILSGNFRGIRVAPGASGNTIENNFMGTDVSGTIDLGNSFEGMEVSGSNNTIKDNLISGNDQTGLLIRDSATGNSVIGNFIGTDAAGTTALPNSNKGMFLFHASNHTIGGTDPADRNVISGNVGPGLLIQGPSADGNVVQGNYIGVDSTGSSALGNTGFGLDLRRTTNTQVGGTTAGSGNVISANGLGVIITASDATNNVLEGNLIGTTSTGAGGLGNDNGGIRIDRGSSGNAVGGHSPGAANTVSSNGGHGVQVLRGTQNSITGNSIHGNSGLGIDLLGGTGPGGGVTANDSGDADTGANDLQNFPVIAGVSVDASGTAISGVLNSSPNSSFSLEFFANGSCDPTGFGEGESFLGSMSVSTDALGNAGFTAVFPVLVPAGSSITATATNAAGSTSEFSECQPVKASIAITKDPPSQQVVSGGTASFTLTVENTGDVALDNVVVTDAQVADCAKSIGTLASGGTDQYACDAIDVTTDFTNEAAVSGEPPTGPAVSASDTAEVDVIAPSLSVTKEPATQQVVTGGTASFTITVDNTGDVALDNVAVTDAQVADCAKSIGTLAAGGTDQYACDAANVTSDFTNEAEVSGDPPTGPAVTSSDTAEVDVIAPAISITKDPATQQVVSGGTASFTITVENTGDVTLDNVAVTDAQVSDCAKSIGTLASGGTDQYTCDAIDVTADFANQADVSGDPPTGPAVSASDTADVDVIDPSISITKDPASQQVVTGGTASFTITVENTGDVTLDNVTVTDAQVSDCAKSIGTLASGASEQYTCEAPDVTADFTNEAEVSGDPPTGPAVTSSDTAEVDVIAPAISITKEPATQQVVTGGTASFTITVENTGGVVLEGIAVTDAQAPACDRSIGTLPPGADHRYTCDVSNVTSDFTNEAEVRGDPPAGPAVTASDTAAVDVTDDDGDGVPDAMEDAAPGGGDGNRDGVPDSRQGDVASLVTATGQGYATLELSGSCDQLLDVTAVDPTTLPDDAGRTYPHGLVGFEVPCESAVVDIHFHGRLEDPGKMVYRKYGPTVPGDLATIAWYDFSEFTTGGNSSWTLFLEDGHLGDDTGADGRIVDAGGPAPATVLEIPVLGPCGTVLLTLFLALLGWVLLPLVLERG